MKTCPPDGFTMVELLLVIIVIAMVGIIALPRFLDFRQEAKVAAAKHFLGNLRSSLAAKHMQLMARCAASNNAWPRLEAIELNDMTEGGAAGALCTSNQIPNADDRRFLAGSAGPLSIPNNPYTNLATLSPCSCSSVCDASCTAEAGYCYNSATGQVWGRGLSSECHGSDLSSSSSSSSSLVSSSSSSDSSSSSSEDPEQACNDAGRQWNWYDSTCHDDISADCAVSGGTMQGGTCFPTAQAACNDQGGYWDSGLSTCYASEQDWCTQIGGGPTGMWYNGHCEVTRDQWCQDQGRYISQDHYGCFATTAERDCSDSGGTWNGSSCIP